MTEVIRVVKHVHISGRWPTSRQHRFGRYVQGAMPKVVGRQRIKRARSAREDSSISIYIYIYLYIIGVPFPRSKARKLAPPRWFQAAKNDFLTVPVAGSTFGCL